MEEIIFPNQIRMIRRTRGKTMKSIADILGVSLSAISKIEKGYRRIDEAQLEKVSAFLDCPKKSIFVYEQTSQPEVLQAWNKEKERRKQINEKSGLKTMGAGLRYLRGEKMLTLHDVSKGAGLTLSVYHRIEMGQREVSENQFKRIAHALGYTPESLQIKIYELDMSGALNELKRTEKSGIFHSKGGYNDLPVSAAAKSFYEKLPVYYANENEVLLLETPTEHIDPSTANKETLYAVCPHHLREDYPFPAGRTIFIADKAVRPENGDMVLYHLTENEVCIGSVKYRGDGQVLFFPADDGTPTLFSETEKEKMDKIICIKLV